MKNEEGFIVPAGLARNGGPLKIYDDLVWIKVGGQETDGGHVVMEVRTEPGSGPPLHRHGREGESFYVIEGKYKFEIDGREIFAGPGDSVYAPVGTEHTFQNIGKIAGIMLVIAQPAGMDMFFQELAAATQDSGAPDLGIILPIFHKHGLELLGPPLAAREHQLVR